MNTARKEYLNASAKAENLTMEISKLLGCIDAFRDKDEDSWSAIGTMNSINQKLEAVLKEVKGYYAVRVSEQEEQKIGKPEAFYTGGGIWICAMWIDEYHYIAIDNDWYADGFCIYDRREEDDDPEIEFPCECMIGEKLKKDFTDEDKANYKKMKEVLDEEVKQ